MKLIDFRLHSHLLLYKYYLAVKLVGHPKIKFIRVRPASVVRSLRGAGRGHARRVILNTHSPEMTLIPGAEMAFLSVDGQSIGIRPMLQVLFQIEGMSLPMELPVLEEQVKAIMTQLPHCL